MSTLQAKKRGSLMIEGVVVPFDKGMNVSALVSELPTKVVNGLIDEGIWEDVTIEIKEAEKKMGEQLRKVEKAKKKKKG